MGEWGLSQGNPYYEVQRLTMNRIHNSNNPYQNPDKFKRALCLCSAGLLRSPTLAFLLMTKYSRNCRAAGVEDSFALVVADDVLLSWADEVWCVSDAVKNRLWQLAEQNKWENILANKKIITMDIPDCYGYMEDELIRQITIRLEQLMPAINQTA